MIYVFARRLFVSLWLSAGIALALMFCSAVAGQCAAGPQAPDLAEMSIEDLMNITVVTAGKKPQTIANTAAAVFVITRKDIERYGYQTLTQALRRISGFYSETDRYISFVGSRGYLPNSDLNRRVLVLVDGHKVNDYLYGQAPVDQDLAVDMRDIERIEVVKGPGSALWGSEALLCVINCITRTASEIGGLEVRQDLGWRNGQHLAYGHSSPGGLQISGSVSELISDGQQRIYFPEYDTPEKNNGVAVGLDGERVGRGYLNMSYKSLKLFYNHVKRTKNVPTGYWWCGFNGSGTDVADERHYSELSYENPKPYAGDGKLFCRVYKDNYDAVCNWMNGIGVPSTRNTDNTTAWGTEARYSRNISSRVTAILGVEHVQAKARRIYEQVEPYKLRSGPRFRHFTMLSYYMQTDWDATDSLRLVAGTRLDDHSTFGKNWSPRVGLIYKASPKSTLKLLYGKAFRAPSMSETGGDDNPNGLHPETITTTELVWERQIGTNGRLVTSLFGFDMHDLITINEDWDTVLGDITCRGIETQYDYQLHNGGSGYFGLSVLTAKGTNPNNPSDPSLPRLPLPSSPRFVVSSGLSVPVFGDRAYLSPDAQCIGSRKTIAGNSTGVATIVNLALTSRSLIKNADISLGISNLFNTPTFASSEMWNRDADDVALDRVPQIGRTLQFQVTYHM